MTQPKLANLSLWGEANAFHEARAYRDPRDAKHYPSVTSVLKGVPKDLTQYAANEMLKWCIQNWEWLSGRSDEQAFKGARYRWRDHADLRGHVGDGIHNYIEAEQTGSWEYPELNEEQEAILVNWRALNDAYEIVPLRNEVTVGDIELGWMGTFDSYCLVDGKPTLVDFKTSKGVWDTAYMQLAALARATEWFIEGPEMQWTVIPPEPVEQVAVFHLRADSWAVVWVNNIDMYYEQFKHYLELWKLKEQFKVIEKEVEAK